MSDLASFIRRRREELGLTQTQLGRRLGLKQGNFCGMVEKGQSPFPMERWLDWARALEVRPEDFLPMALESVHPSVMPYIKIQTPEPDLAPSLGARPAGQGKPQAGSVRSPDGTPQLRADGVPRLDKSLEPPRSTVAHRKAGQRTRQATLWDDDEWQPGSP
jgi:hypothetical protein